MARTMGYTPPTPRDTAAPDEVADLVRALHESGLLRALAGAVRAYPQLLHRLMGELDPRTLRSAVALTGAVRGLDPDESERLAAGIRRARHDARAAARARPQGPIALARRLRDPDARRGLAAGLAALAAIGAALGPDEEHER